MKRDIEHREPVVEHRLSPAKQREAAKNDRLREVVQRRILEHRARKEAARKGEANER